LQEIGTVAQSVAAVGRLRLIGLGLKGL